MRSQHGFSKLMFLFGLIFFAAGMLVGSIGFIDVYKHIISADWERVPMTILSADLEVNHDEDSTTYAVTADYRYTYNGQQYQGKRVSFSSGADNIGSFHQDTYQQLKQHINSEPWLGYVNPERPEKSVLIRKLRWGLLSLMMLFPVLFGGIGFAVMVAAVWGGRKARQQQRFIQANPEREWQAAPQWRSNRLECGNQGMMWFTVGFAVVWNLISAPLLFILPGEVLDQGNYLALLGLLFPAVGVGMAIWAIRTVKKWRKFGRSYFTMDPFPAHPGGIVRGILELHTPLDCRELDVWLSCIRKVTTGSGKNRSTRQTIIWQDQQSVPLSPGQQQVQFGFKLADDARLSDNRNSSDQLLWKVVCGAEVPGVDFSTEFEVPVVAGEPDQQTRLAAEKMVQHQIRQARLTDAWKDSGVLFSYQGGYPSYRFAAGRNKGIVIAMGAFGLIFAGIGFGTLYFGGLWLFGGIFALVGLLMLWGMLYFLLHSSAFTIKPDRLLVTHTLLRKKTREFPLASIQSIELKPGSSVNNRQFWNIVLATSPTTSGGYAGFKPDKGRRIRLASDIPDRRAAEALLQRITQQLRLDRD